MYTLVISFSLWRNLKIEINRIKYYVALKTEKNILNHLNF